MVAGIIHVKSFPITQRSKCYLFQKKIAFLIVSWYIKRIIKNIEQVKL